MLLLFRTIYISVKWSYALLVVAFLRWNDVSGLQWRICCTYAVRYHQQRSHIRELWMVYKLLKDMFQSNCIKSLPVWLWIVAGLWLCSGSVEPSSLKVADPLPLRSTTATFKIIQRYIKMSIDFRHAFIQILFVIKSSTQKPWNEETVILAACHYDAQQPF